MIPHRVLSNEIVVNGLKGRISACRKRLRDHRPLHKGQISHYMSDELEQRVPETCFSPSDLLDDAPLQGRSLSLRECSAAYGRGDTAASETMSIVEQGVGTT